MCKNPADENLPNNGIIKEAFRGCYMAVDIPYGDILLFYEDDTPIRISTSKLVDILRESDNSSRDLLDFIDRIRQLKNECDIILDVILGIKNENQTK